MAVGHEFRNFGSEEGFGGEDFAIDSPVCAGAVIVRRLFRSRDGRISRDRGAGLFAEGDNAVFNNGSHLGIHNEVGLHIREFLVPTVETEAFEDRSFRSGSVSTVGNALAVNENGVESDKLHVEGVGMAVGHEFRNFGSEEGFGGEDFAIDSPVSAGAVIVRRDNRSRHSRVGRDFDAFGLAEGDDANGRHLGDLTRNVEVFNHLREVLVPAIETIAFAIEFQDFVLRVGSGSFVSNLLGLEESSIIGAFSHIEAHDEFVSMALGHKFRNFGSEEGRIGEGFTINSPFRAGAVFVRRDNRSRHGRVSRNIFALGFAESDDANRRHLGHVGVHIESGNHVREVLIPVFKAIAFNNRIGRSLSGSTIGNALGINHGIKNEELHVELVHGALGFESRQLSNRKFVTGMEFNFAIQPGIASERVAGRRIIRDNNRRIHRDRVTLSGINRNEADFSHCSQESVDFEVGLHVRESLVPTVKAEAIDSRIGRSLSVSIESNSLFVVGSTLDKERHSEGLGNLFELSSVNRILGSSSKRPVPTRELEGCGIRIEVSRDFRVVFFVVVEDHGTLFEGLLAQFLTEAGHEGDFKELVQHGIVGHSTSVELSLSFGRSQHVAMVVLPAAEHCASDLRVGNSRFNNLALNGRRFENDFAIDNERNFVVASAAREVKHRIVTVFEEPDKGIINFAVLGVKNPNKITVSVHFSGRLTQHCGNRRAVVFVGAIRLHLLKGGRIVVAVFDRRIGGLLAIFIVDLTNNTTLSLTDNRVGRAEGVQHHSRVVARAISRIVIEIAFTNNTTGSTAPSRSSHGTIVAAVIDGAILVVAHDTASIGGAVYGAQVLASSNAARNVGDVGFNISIMRASHNTTGSIAGYRAIVDTGADSTRVRTGNTASQFRGRDRSMVFATNHRAVTTVTTGNTTNTTIGGITRRLHLDRLSRLAAFEHTIVQANDGTRIFRVSYIHNGIADGNILDNTLLTNHTKEARIGLAGTGNLNNLQSGNRHSIAIEDTFEGLVFGLTDRFEFRITTINVIHHDGIDDLAVFGPVTELVQVRTLCKFCVVFTKYGRISHSSSE